MSILSIRADSTCDSTYFPQKKVKNVEKWGLQLKNEETGWSKKIAKNAQNMKLTKIVTSCDFFLIPPRKHSWVVDKCKRPHGKIFSFTHFLDFWSHFWIFWTSCYPAPLFILQNYQISTESNALGLKISVIAPATNLVRFRVIIFSPFSRKTLENGSFWHFSNFSK